MSTFPPQFYLLVMKWGFFVFQIANKLFCFFSPCHMQICRLFMLHAYYTAGKWYYKKLVGTVPFCLAFNRFVEESLIEFQMTEHWMKIKAVIFHLSSAREVITLIFCLYRGQMLSLFKQCTWISKTKWAYLCYTGMYFWVVISHFSDQQDI